MYVHNLNRANKSGNIESLEKYTVCFIYNDR